MFNFGKIKRFLPHIWFLSIYTVVFFIVFATLKYTFPFVAGFLLGLMLQPFIAFVSNRLHLKKSLAAFLATLLTFLILFGLLFFLGFRLVSEIKALVENLSAADLSKVKELLNDMINQVGGYIDRIDAQYITQNQDQIMSAAAGGISVLSALLIGILRFFTSLPVIFTMFIVIIFSTYFFSKDMENIKRTVKSQFSLNAVNQISSAANHGFAMMGKYISAYMLIYFITCLESFFIFSLLRVPYPLVLSIVCGVADIIPVLGPGTVYLPTAVFMLFQGNFFVAAGLVISWLLITVIRQILEPKIVSSSIEIHPLAMLAALYISLISGSFLMLLYFTILFILYQILKKVNILSPVFPQPQNEALKNSISTN